MSKFYFKSFVLLICIIFLSISNVYAIDDSQEVSDDYTFEDTIVTATKRAERLQDIPQSITALSEDDLKFMGAKNFSDMMESIAGVSFKIGRLEDSSVTIRGIAPLGAVSGGAGASVGYYLDELPLTMANVMPDIASSDTARVEVLRGPQGTLFGAGSLAGTIRLIANKPDSSGLNGNVSLTYSDTEGGADSYAANAVLNVPLIKDKAAFRLVGIYEDNGGYIDRINPDTGALVRENDNGNKKTGGRLALRLTPSDPLTLDMTMLYSKSDVDGANQANSEYESNSFFKAWSEDELYAANLTIQYEFSFADLISSTSYFDRKISAERDSPDSTPAVEQFINLMAGNYYPYVPFPGMAYFGLTPPDIFDLDTIYTTKSIEADAFAQEIRLVSKGDGPWHWVVGVFYKKHEATNKTAGFSQPAVDPMFESDLGNLPVIPGFYDFSGVPSYGYRLDSTVTYTQYAGFGELSYDFTDNLMTYVQYSKGFRSGGQNEILLTGAPKDFEPETLTNYELGLKTTFFNGRARFNIGLFHMQWESFQGIVLRGPNGIGDAYDNIGDAHSTGVDLELTVRPVQGLSWTFGGSFLEAETDDDYTILGETVPAGTRIPLVSELTYSTALQYNFPITQNLLGFTRISYAYCSDAKAQTLGYPFETPSYQFVDFKAGIEQNSWQITFFVNNLFDEAIIYERGYTPDPDIYTGSLDDLDQTFSRPRTIGVTFRYNF